MKKVISQLNSVKVLSKTEQKSVTGGTGWPCEWFWGCCDQNADCGDCFYCDIGQCWYLRELCQGGGVG